MDFYFFCFMVLGLLACLGDAYTTAIGIGSGAFQEADPVPRFLFSKIGEALTDFLGCALFLFSAGLLYTFTKPWIGWAFTGGILALETFNTVRNYLLNKKAKVI